MTSLAPYAADAARTHAERLRDAAGGADARGDSEGAAALRAEADLLDAR